MPSPVNAELRKQVINIYKELLNLGKDYPQGHEYFRRRLHTAFSANSALRDDDAIRRAIARAQFVQKGEDP
ncbi:LYR family protein [Sporothrix schenckii 1099-18]|uniref:LYR family protein n=1 Tax=Sporothrix schenckii 1099-18 TaxID=1397361 RepID=A0A0F2MHI4_SPOSC|nr:LYR family protein [Sporothrix schenckii 1099-18]KJR87631.1 LYR family protein [Sporothrix schenckii 1099-18]